MKQSKPFKAGAIGIVTACFASLLFIGSSQAQPLYVSVSSAQYMTYVSVTQQTNGLGQGGNTVSRTTTSSSPISDEIDLPVLVRDPEGIITHAIANAGLFAVSDQTGWGYAGAEAISQIWFSPLTDQTQSIGIQIDCDYMAFNACQITLWDLTSNSELWDYSWNRSGLAGPVTVPSLDNIPWNLPGGPGGTDANFSLSTAFLASDQYELTMIVSSQAGGDKENIQMQLTGLQVVPEPSAILLITLCITILVVYRHRSIPMTMPPDNALESFERVGNK